MDNSLTRRQFLCRGLQLAGLVASLGIPGLCSAPAAPATAPEGATVHRYLAELVDSRGSAHEVGTRMYFRQPLVPEGWKVIAEGEVSPARVVERHAKLAARAARADWDERESAPQVARKAVTVTRP